MAEDALRPCLNRLRSLGGARLKWARLALVCSFPDRDQAEREVGNVFYLKRKEREK